MHAARLIVCSKLLGTRRRGHDLYQFDRMQTIGDRKVWHSFLPRGQRPCIFSGNRNRSTPKIWEVRTEVNGR